MPISPAGRYSAWTFVAPVVLLVAVLVVVNVLQDALADGSSSDRSGEAARVAATTVEDDAAAGGATTGRAPAASGADTAPARTAAPAPRTYVVRSGDTLGAIAERFGTSTERLRALNPDLDPTAMQPGDRVRVAA